MLKSLSVIIYALVITAKQGITAVYHIVNSKPEVARIFQCSFIITNSPFIITKFIKIICFAYLKVIIGESDSEIAGIQPD